MGSKILFNTVFINLEQVVHFLKLNYSEYLINSRVFQYKNEKAQKAKEEYGRCTTTVCTVYIINVNINFVTEIFYCCSSSWVSLTVRNFFR